MTNTCTTVLQAQLLSGRECECEHEEGGEALQLRGPEVGRRDEAGAGAEEEEGARGRWRERGRRGERGDERSEAAREGS